MGAALKSWLQNTKDESETTVSDRNRGEVAITGTISVRGQVLAGDAGVVHDGEQ